jgi:multiple sugar transport system ATP-binding protein
MNLFEADVTADGTQLAFGDTRLDLGSRSLRDYDGRRIVVGIRPEEVREASGWDGARVRGRVLLVEALGAEQLVHIEIAATPLERADLVDAAAQPPGPSLGVEDLERSVTLLGRFDRHLLLTPGEAVEVAIDARLLHFFDLETGAALPGADVPAVAGVAG